MITSPGNPVGATATSQNITTRKEKRRRIQMRFFLDANNDTDNAIGWYLAEAKKQRQMTHIIRNGVRLFLSLREGRVDVLLALFPDTPRHLRQHFIGGE